MTYNVRICDDQERLEKAWVGKASSVAPQDQYKIEGMSRIENSESESERSVLVESIEELLARRSALRDSPPKDRDAIPCMFDETDILILDYDLLHIDKRHARHTGEGLAKLARTFSECGAIVVLNQFREIHFDLSLRGHVWSYADLNVQADLLDKKGLWSESDPDEFRPWHWCQLSDAVELQKSRRRFVSERFEEQILDAIGMQVQDVSRLSDSAFEFLCPSADGFSELEALTFNRFLTEGSGDLDAQAAGDADKEAAARFVGARIGKWLEREVMGAQDVLIDIPHLIQRYPFLLGEDCGELDAWNGALRDHTFIEKQVPKDCWFQHSELLSRASVWRQRFEANNDISEQSYKFDYSKVPAYVFLEDISLFAPIETAREFRAGFHNAFDSRFVRKIEEITYGPQRRFAMRD